MQGATIDNGGKCVHKLGHNAQVLTAMFAPFERFDEKPVDMTLTLLLHLEADFREKERHGYETTELAAIDYDPDAPSK